MPPLKRSQFPPPIRQLDAAKSSLQHLSDQERLITAKVLPPDDPVEAVFKPPEALPHSYQVGGGRRGGGGLAAPVGLRIPKMPFADGPWATAGGPPTEELDDPASATANGAGSPVSYNKVRRWEMLPKHAWLQAAESGQAPGPGFRDVSASQTMRSYGPPKAAQAPSASQIIEPLAPAATAERESPSTRIGASYSPKARGLQTSTLFMGVPEGMDEEVDISDAAVPEEEAASTFLPQEFFDGGEMEPFGDELWETAEEKYLKGKPYCARSKYYTVDGTGSSLLPCEVCALDRPFLSLSLLHLAAHTYPITPLLKITGRALPPRGGQIRGPMGEYRQAEALHAAQFTL